MTRALLLAALVSAIPASAAAQVSVEVSPLRVELQAPAGSTTTQAITLTNVGATGVRVRATLSDWYLSRDGSPQFDEPLAGRPYAAAPWVKFAPPELVLAGNSTGTVRFTLAVPKTVDPASYRTAILFDFTPVDAAGSDAVRQVRFKSRIATLIYVNVGQVPPVLELTDMRVRATPEQTAVIATLKNSSRRSVRTKGTLVLYDAAGAAVREVPVPDVPILPESERDVAVVAIEATRGLPQGRYLSLIHI